MSVILMTTLFYKALILQGENWCWSLLGLKGLKVDLGFESGWHIHPAVLGGLQTFSLRSIFHIFNVAVLLTIEGTVIMIIKVVFV